MKKKIFGVKISTILQALLCVLFAFVIWFTVKYNDSADQAKETAVAMLEAESSYESL